MQTKICFKCGLEKPLSQYYKHPQMSDGRLGKCKECAKRDVKTKRIKIKRRPELGGEREKT
jgi:ubiquitin C-terminal hydrolase